MHTHDTRAANNIRITLPKAKFNSQERIINATYLIFNELASDIKSIKEKNNERQEFSTTCYNVSVFIVRVSQLILDIYRCETKCWNITSFLKRDQEILIELTSHKIDICALSETKKKGKGSTKYNNFVLVYSGKDKTERASSGVGLLIHEKFEKSISHIEYTNDRILLVTLNLQQHIKTHIISIYAPDISKTKTEKDAFYTELQKVIDKIPPRDEIILLGDFNARVGNDAVRGIKQRFNESEMNDNGERLTQFCAQNELRINNTFFDHKLQHKYTFVDSRGRKSIIDYIITNINVHPAKIMDVRVLSSANVGTDLNLVLMKLNSKLPTGVNQTSQIVEKINSKIQTNKIEEEDDVNNAWNKLKTNILEAATESIGKRTVNINNKKRNLKPWFCEEVKVLASEKREAYLRFKRQQVSYNEYKVVRNRINIAIDNIKKNYWENFSNEMEHDLYGAPKKVWNMLRNRKKPINEYLTFSNIQIEAWEEYFCDLYNSVALPDDYRNNNQSYAGGRAYYLSCDIVKANISKLKNRKSPRIDEISNAMIKYGGEQFQNEIVHLFNKILTYKQAPREWKNSITVPIFKKGDKNLPENYRGITLLSSMLKLFTEIVSIEVAGTGIAEEQQGFRTNRSTTDAIFILRQITENSTHQLIFVLLI
ncbi:uncharacterized protein LOC129613898 [Condylostylus longicornis]|uniref:uncharacterized protein LOC129613898 n=1 Tax=Condylostylus longicornis TaxID=2530218 RepID=UPI00244E1865|nr:uncharacterized protein LOC129613898 [Condylostylus longicornis]